MLVSYAHTSHSLLYTRYIIHKYKYIPSSAVIKIQVVMLRRVRSTEGELPGVIGWDSGHLDVICRTIPFLQIEVIERPKL
jgi:hypothetical protein